MPFEVAMPEPRSADCYGVDDGYKSPRHMLDTAERDALVDKVSRLHGVFEQYIYIYIYIECQQGGQLQASGSVLHLRHLSR